MSGHTTNPYAADPEPWHHEPEEEERGTLLEVVITIGAALLLAFLVQQYLVKPFKIPSGSMENTLHCGDRVLVDRITYRFKDPARKDIVVFNPPAGIGEGGRPDPSIVADETTAARTEKDGTRTDTAADTNYIKRIIGLPGDTVEVKDHHANVNGAKLKEPYLRPLEEVAGISDGTRSDWGPKEVPKGAYLMLGDHRDNSADGRVFGFVPRDFIVGKAFMVYWPPKRFGGLPDKDPGGVKATQADPNCLEGSVPAGQTTEQE
jgi:signal peptidase I